MTSFALDDFHRPHFVIILTVILPFSPTRVGGRALGQSSLNECFTWRSLTLLYSPQTCRRYFSSSSFQKHIRKISNFFRIFPNRQVCCRLQLASNHPSSSSSSFSSICARHYRLWLLLTLLFLSGRNFIILCEALTTKRRKEEEEEKMNDSKPLMDFLWNIIRSCANSPANFLEYFCGTYRFGFGLFSTSRYAVQCSPVHSFAVLLRDVHSREEWSWTV